MKHYGDKYDTILCTDCICLAGCGNRLFCCRPWLFQRGGIAGQAASGVVAEDPGKFVYSMILQARPSTQAIYGLVIAILILGRVTPDITLEQATMLFMAGLPVGFVGYLSGVYQGKVAASGINLIAKRPESFGHAMIFAINVELFAIFSFAASFFILGKVPV